MLLPITIDSTECLLLTAEPDRAGALQTTCKHLIQREVGLSNREHRRAYSAALRWTLKFSARLNLAEGRALRAALRGSDNQPILCPMWPAAGLVSDAATAPLVGGLKVTWEPDWSAYELHTGAAAGSYSATAMTAPVLWARWDKPPEPVAESDERGDVAFSLVENGPAEYAIGPRSTATIAGPVIGGAARPLLAEHCDYGRDLASGGIDLRIARETIGYGRAEAEEYVSQSPRSTGSFYFKGDAEAAMRLVALFHASRGSAGTIWWPAAHAEWRLAADVTTAAVQLESAPVAPHPDYLALRKTDGTLVARRISAIEGATLTLDSAPGAIARHSTTLLPLFLGRFNTTELKLDWTKPRAITADIPLIELPTETELPEGETAGTTIGDLGTPIWLYHVSDGDLDWYYTSFESEIDAGALGGPEHKPFLPRPIDHGDITSELNLQRHDCDLTVGWFAGSPFERARLDRLAPPLTVQIYEGKLSAPAAAEVIFTGKAAGYQFQGGKCTCKIAGPTALFDVRGPVAITSPRCWTPMYSTLCGLSREALSVAADLVGIDADGTLRFVAAGSSSFDVTPADWYRYGYAVRTLADGSRRTIAVAGSSGVYATATRPEASGMVGWFDFSTGLMYQNSVDGTDALMDATGIEIAGTPETVAGIRGASVRTGNGHFLVARDSNFARFTGSFSVGFWFRLDGAYELTNLAMLLARELQAASGADRCFEIFWRDAKLSLSVATDSGYVFLDSSGLGVTYPPGQWYFVGFGYDVASGEIFLFDWRAGRVTKHVGAKHVTDYRLSIGFVPTSTSIAASQYRTSAAFDSMGFWDRILADTEFSWLANGGVGRTFADFSATDLTIGVAPQRPVPAPASYPDSGWVLYPGCDHSWARCKALGNRANFRGCPHFPKSNPAMVSVKQETSSGSKK